MRSRGLSLGAFCGVLLALNVSAACAQPRFYGMSQIEVRDFFRSNDRATFRIWQDYELKAGDTVRHIVVVSGTATIDGTVNGDVVVVLGSAKIGATAIIRGSLVVVGGSTMITAGATIRGDLVAVGGPLDAPPGFMPGGEHVVVGASWLNEPLRAMAPWFTHGLLWGRVFVPSIPWVWTVALVFLMLSLGLNLLFHEPVGVCARTLANKPFSTFLSGLLVLLLVGPMSVLLAATVVGIVVIPFLWCALILAGLVGKVGVARWIGRSLTGQGDPESRAQGIRSFLLGFLAIFFLYALPIVGLVTWAIVGVFGIGAAWRTFLAGLRRERPPKVPKPAKVKPADRIVPPTSPTPDPSPVSAFVPEPPAAPVPSTDWMRSTPLYAAPAVPVATDAGIGPDPLEPPAATASAASHIPIASEHDDLRTLTRATFLDRLAAFALDVILVVVVSNMLNIMRDSRYHDSPPGPFFVLLFLYFVLFWSWKGTTVGGIMCNLRVIRMDGRPLRFADAFVRGLASIFSFLPLGVGVLWILKEPNPQRQAWHDLIAGTYVVRVPKEWPLP